jgi:tRNA modification GTPase
MSRAGTQDATIFAPATAAGRAGVAVVRISGPGVRDALAALSIALPAPRHATRARFRDAATGDMMDDGLVLFFPGPASFTGEDVAELHLHGSRAVLDAVASTLSRVPGLRLAEPGEFTRRAFEHGKLDLTEAEAVADLVAAETAAQRRQALRQLEGELGRLYGSWALRLLRTIAHLEAAIDFPEEGLPAELDEAARRELEELRAAMTAHLADNRAGEILRDGVSIAIVGPPNAGKSSLLNALARRDVAITSAVAGTTRDVIEVRLDLGGYPVILADTAGLRLARDEIEAEGVRRARVRAEAADLRIVVFDATRPEELVDLDALADGAVVVANKIDLGGSPGRGSGALPVSVLTGDGIEELLARLTVIVRERFAAGDAPVLTRARHRAALEECVASLGRALVAELPELVAEDVRLAVRSLGRITGRVDVEDVLDVIFREFCIGK